MENNYFREFRKAISDPSESKLIFGFDLNENESLTNIYLEGPYRFRHITIMGKTL